MSGTNDTSFAPAGLAGSCPCGRSHSPHVVKPPRPRRLEADLKAELYDAFTEGKHRIAEGFHEINYARDCMSALRINASDGNTLPVRRLVRCRRCAACLRARTNYWGAAAQAETLEGQSRGLRTWFGTLTIADHEEFVLRARQAHPEGNAPWWEETRPATYWCRKRRKAIEIEAFVCDERFRAVRDQVLPEVQKFWKRLRKAGHRFKYFLVFERHKSGEVHMHFLLHELEGRITKRAIQAQWPWGHSNVSIVGGRSKEAAAPNKAAWYVVKYLSKSVQARQIASRKYRPRVRT